jgi:hypothetical protein
MAYAAQDIRPQVEAWVIDEIRKCALGEQYGFAVTWGPQPVPNGQGGAVLVPAWACVITCQNPLLGQGDLYHLAQLGAPRPKEADVRREVADGIRQLRDLARTKIGEPNGHAQQTAVPG